MADYSDSFDPAHEQEQELLVVQSIFMDEFKRLPDEPASGGHGICKVVKLTILPCPNEPDANHCDARLLVRLEPSYPIQPPLLTVQAGDLSQPSEAVASSKPPSAALCAAKARARGSRSVASTEAAPACAAASEARPSPLPISTIARLATSSGRSSSRRDSASAEGHSCAQ